MKFIVTKTHGAVNADHIRRFHPNEDGSLTLHVNHEGALQIPAEEVPEVLSQLDAAQQAGPPAPWLQPPAPADATATPDAPTADPPARGRRRGQPESAEGAGS